MSTWVLPAGSTDETGAQDGDVLLRREGDELHVARVVAGAVEWLGPVPAGSLDLPDVDGPTEAPDLEEAARGIEAALVGRGG